MLTSTKCTILCAGRASPDNDVLVHKVHSTCTYATWGMRQHITIVGMHMIDSMCEKADTVCPTVAAN